MSEAHEKKDNVEKPEVKMALSTPDSQAARNAGAKDLQNAEAARTNASDGSLSKHVAGHQDHDESIQIVFDSHVISRKNAQKN